MSVERKSLRRRLGRLLQRLNPLSGGRIRRFRSHGLGFDALAERRGSRASTRSPRLEPLEARQLLSATLWVADNWVVTAPSGHVGDSAVTGDTVAE
jgi:hypothetical protein